MRGTDDRQQPLFSVVTLEQRVPVDHPLRAIRQMTDEALEELSPLFERLYAKTGRPSIAPERLLRALLLQVLYSVRSERMLMEQLDYNLLFRWFVGLTPDEPVWVPTVFTKNRDRLLEGEVATAFFAVVLGQAKAKNLTSSEHFTVDGTLVEAWAGHKSFKPIDAEPPKEGEVPPPPDDPGNPTVNFKKTKRSKGYDVREFVESLDALGVAPHIARHTNKRRSAVPEAYERDAGYQVSQRKRKLVEEGFGWMKAVGMVRQVKHRGLQKVRWLFTFTAAAYNLVRLRRLATCA